MPDARSHGSVSSDLTQMLLAGRDDLREWLRRAGVDPSVLERSHQRIPARQFDALWSEIEKATGDRRLGLHLGALPAGLPAGHVLFSAMMNSPTVGDALARYCRYHDLMADVVRPRLYLRGGSTVVAVEPSSPTTRLHPQHVECIAALFVSVMRQLAAGRFEGTIHFQHAAPADPSEHHRLLGPSVLFGRPNDEIVLERAFLDTAIPRADPELLPMLDQHAAVLTRRARPASPWSARVSQETGRVLCDGRPRLGDIARRLAVSGRTLQNRLEAEGTTYQALLDGVRRRMAESYLDETEMTVGEIAFLLGFADPSAFTHAFRRWAGVSPASFRARGDPATPPSRSSPGSSAGPRRSPSGRRRGRRGTGAG